MANVRQWIERSDPQIILLHGFFLSYILVNAIAMLFDGSHGRWFDVGIEGVTLGLSLFFLWQLHRFNRIRLAALGAIWIGALAVLLFLYVNRFANHFVILVVMVPLASFFLLRSLKEALAHSLLIYLLLGALMAYGYGAFADNPLLHNPAALLNTLYAAIFILFFGVFYHLAIDRSYRKLALSNRQKELLLKEVHHRVKNNLNVVASLLGLQSNRALPEVREQLQSSHSRVQSIALVHEMLYREEDFGRVGFGHYMKNLAELNRRMFPGHTDVAIRIEGGETTLLLTTMVQLGLLCNELLLNSLKYAFPSGGGTITIGLETYGESYRFTYRDDGVGPADGTWSGENDTLGYKLVQLTSMQLEGTIFPVAHTRGFAFELRFQEVVE